MYYSSIVFGMQTCHQRVIRDPNPVVLFNVFVFLTLGVLRPPPRCTAPTKMKRRTRIPYHTRHTSRTWGSVLWKCDLAERDDEATEED